MSSVISFWSYTKTNPDAQTSAAIFLFGDVSKNQEKLYGDIPKSISYTKLEGYKMNGFATIIPDGQTDGKAERFVEAGGIYTP